MVAAVVVVAALLIGVGAIIAVHRRRWDSRLLRQIRALPEHAGERVRR